MADILVIDDQDRTIELCRRAMPELTWHGPARSWAEAQEELRRLRRQVELVLLDVHFDIPAEALLGLPEAPTERDVRRAQRVQGKHILEALRRGAPDLPVVLMTARGGVGLESMADRHQAEEYTYFLQDEDIDARTLRAQVTGILRARLGREQDGPVYWGRSLDMRRIRQRLSVLARGRLPVILAGPTGTGKSLIARHFIHPRSGRKGNFVAVDLATLPRDLVAAHLFGSTRGAYTGSVADRKGAFEEADQGTLFLDEIGNLSPEHQKMLLTVLQEGAVTRLGDVRERRVDIKLVVATNEDLGEMVRKGQFRADLYMRLNPAATVALPPLRQRQMDMERLLKSVVERVVSLPSFREILAEYVGQAELGVLTGAAETARRRRGTSKSGTADTSPTDPPTAPEPLPSGVTAPTAGNSPSSMADSNSPASRETPAMRPRPTRCCCSDQRCRSLRSTVWAVPPEGGCQSVPDIVGLTSIRPSVSVSTVSVWGNVSRSWCGSFSPGGP